MDMLSTDILFSFLPFLLFPPLLQAVSGPHIFLPLDEVQQINMKDADFAGTVHAAINDRT